MKILIMVLCIVILLRNKKEGIFGKKKFKVKVPSVSKIVSDAGKGVKSVGNYIITTSPAKMVSDAKKAAQRAAEAAQRGAEAARQLAIEQAKCYKILTEHNKIAAERSMWGQKIKDLRNQATYYDHNFNKDIYKYFESDMTVLNEIINKNTNLNNELSKILNRINFYQKNKKKILDQLKTENTNLKECKMNKELTDTDYNVLN